MKRSTRKIAAIAGLVAIIMFSFSFALSPLYRAICKVTALNGSANSYEVAPSNQVIAAPASSDYIQMQFVTTTNNNLPWIFYVKQNSLRVQPNQIIKDFFYIKNNSNKKMTIQAIAAFTPPIAAKYVHKIECFCFRQLTLEAHEERLVPVVLRIDSAIPSDLRTITLAYTLFDITKRVKHE